MPWLSLVKIVLSPAVLVFAASLLLALGAWLTSSLVDFDPLLRWPLVMLFPLLGIGVIFAARRSRRVNKSPLKPLTPEDQDYRAEQVKEFILSGVRAIQRARGKKENSKKGLNKLPWYLVIGQSSSGKTEMLRNSGLSFPHDEPQTIMEKGAEGTRGCDWWLADCGAFIDTTGRLSEGQESRNEWLALLGELRHWRPSRPLNGVLVTVSVGDLLRCDNEAVQRKAWLIRERLDDLRQNLRMDVPVFLIFTQADQIRGFDSFFSGLSPQQRNQPWGFELDGGAEHLAAQIAALGQRIDSLRLAKVATLQELGERVLAFEFPLRFNRFCRRMNHFVELLVRANYYRRSPRLEGLYLTSSRVFSATLDRRKQGRGESHFIYGLLTERVLPLADKAQPLPHRLLLHKGMKGVIAGVAASLVVVGFNSFADSAQHEIALAERTGTQIATAQQVLGAPHSSNQERFAALEGLHKNWLVLRERLHLPVWKKLFGINTAQLQLSELEPLMSKLVSETLLSEAITELTEALHRYSAVWRELDSVGRERVRSDYYLALAVYRMLSIDPDRLVPEVASKVLADHWLSNQDHNLNRSQAQAITHSLKLVLNLAGDAKQDEVQHQVANVAGTDNQSSRLSQHSSFILEPDHRLIELARQDHALQLDAQSVYERVLAKAANKFDPLTLNDLIDGRDRAFLRAPMQGGHISGAFGGGVWESYMLDRVRRLLSNKSLDDWVVTAPGGEQGNRLLAKRELIDKIEQLYIEDFVSAWLEFIATLRPVGFASLHDSASRLERFAAADGTLANLFSSIRQHLAHHAADLPLDLASAVVSSDRWVRLDNDRRGMELLGLLKVAEGEQALPISLLEYSQHVMALQKQVEKLVYSSDQGAQSKAYAAAILGGGNQDISLYLAFISVDRALAGVSHELRSSLRPLLIAPLKRTWEQILWAARGHIDSRWQEEVLATYRASLIGRFPLSGAGQDAAVGDFEGFFRSNEGELWMFVDGHLAPFVERRGGRWREKTWQGVGLGIRPSFLVMMDRAEQITSSLFGESGHLNLTFFVSAKPNPDLVDMRMDVNGDGLRYRNEPERWYSFSWSGNGVYGARVAAVSGITGGSAQLRASGDWALLRLLQGADRVRAESPADLIAEWDLYKGADTQHRPLQVHIRTERSAPVLAWRDWGRFELPSRVTH